MSAERTEAWTLDELLEDRGWIRDGSCWVRPDRGHGGHVHGPSCSVESCGATARFFCATGPVCLRRFRLSKGEDQAPCTGHAVPTRERLIAYALKHHELRQAAPRGTPLDDDETPNTWSTER